MQPQKSTHTLVRRIGFLTTLLIAATWLVAAPPPGYYDSAMGLSGNALRRALNNIIKNHTVLPYTSSSTTDTRAALKILDEDPNNTNNVLLHYKGTSVAKSSFGTLWNREHVWPQSLGADVLPPETDLHHLFAEDPSLNSSRGNSVFNYVYPNHTNSGYGNYWTSTQFEVRDPQKGDVARALFYMDVRYDGTGGAADFVLSNTTSPSYGQMGVLSALIQWHNFDPPDAREQERNDKIYTLFQHNRNPFIDHPEFVYLIWGPVANGDTLNVAYTNRATATVGAGSANYPLLSLNLTANSNEWDLQSVGLSNIGTLPDSGISAIRLYRDMDNSGSVTAGDIELAWGTFSGGNLTLTCADPSRVTTSTVNFLIAADVATTAPTGSTLRVQVNSLTSSSTGGTDPNPSFTAFSNTPATVSGGVSDGDTLSVSFTNRAGATISAGAVDYPFVTLQCAANSNEWDLASLAITKLGTVEDSRVVAVKLYYDVDQDGVADTGDTLLDTKTLSSGTATFAPSQPFRITTTPVHLLVVATISSTQTNGQTLGFRINANGLTRSISGGNDVNPSFSAFDSGLASVTGGVTDGDTLSVSATSVAPTTVPAGAMNVPLLALTLTASSNEWDVNTISISRNGTLSDSQIPAVSLYEDANNNGVVDAGETELDIRNFSGGSVTFQLNGAVRVTPTPMYLLVAVDIANTAPNASTIGVTLNANGITSAASGGNDVNPTFSAQSSNLTSVVNISAIPDVKIVMVSTRGSDGTAAKEFLVLANHTANTVSLSGWQLRTRAGAATSDITLNLSGSIPPYAHFLIASQPYGSNCEGVTPNFSDTNVSGLFGGMSDTTGRSIGLFDGTGTGANRVDGFSFNGGATNPNNLHEGTAFSGGSGSSTVSFARKRPGGAGTFYTDTDNNASDLQTITSKTPPTDFLPVSVSHFSVE
ncbi:MAG: hypothetical protein D6691_05335 [Candidatus Hydrogenedentota bacterium]|uniref:Extracellular ribonuclease Bsn n=1 Tax=Sumerlaea chitinivorans TaxID=2250252 RepID=A0A2Z4Y6L0_SUMC1|nr:Extracellular ribonuclease Bsn [Candidatus Sumerlaea chitinivorans]MCX7964716.1 endonuclease [Candidatus Sumerlaea chitinivorans]RMH27883.1 MAG: hypothetical protein D6691_05335 [Candidatus Hydrogenedentota bacterium]